MFAGRREGFDFRGVTPRLLRDEARDTPEGEAQNILPGTRCRQVNVDRCLHLDDARGDFDEAQAQRVELGDAPYRTFRHRCAQTPHEPIGARVQEQPQLVGRSLRARGAVGRQMRLPGFDVIFGVAAPTINILVERAGVARLEIGDDEARVGPLRASLDAGDDALDAAPTCGSVVELLEATYLVVSRRGLEARFHAGFEALDVATQCRGRRDAEDVIEPVGATKVENLGSAIMTVAAQHDLRFRPMGADGAQQATQKGFDFLAAGSFGGRSTAVMKRPWPSNTTIG